MTRLSGDLGEKGVGGGIAAAYSLLKQLTVCHTRCSSNSIGTRPNEVRNLEHIILTFKIFVGHY